MLGARDISLNRFFILRWVRMIGQQKFWKDNSSGKWYRLPKTLQCRYPNTIKEILALPRIAPLCHFTLHTVRDSRVASWKNLSWLGFGRVTGFLRVSNPKTSQCRVLRTRSLTHGRWSSFVDLLTQRIKVRYQRHCGHASGFQISLHRY